MVNRRGQLLLTAAILVSLTIVASAVLLNDIHASADVKAQQERQSLEQTERDIEQLQDSLEELFMVNGSQQRLPYAKNGSKLAAATEEFARQYLNMSTQHSAAFINVSFLGESASETGDVYTQFESRNFTPPGSSYQVIKDGASLQRMSLEIDSIDSGDSLSLKLGTGEKLDIENTSGNSEVLVSGDINGTCQKGPVTNDRTLEIEVVDGSGEIRYNGRHCREIEFGEGYGDSTGNSPIWFKGDRDAVTGTFVFAVENATDGAQWNNSDKYRKRSSGVIINPMFRLTYDDPQVSYETNVTAYGGGS
jgi:hypothetical protein